MNAWRIVFSIAALMGATLIVCKAFGWTPLPWWVVLLPFDLLGAFVVLLLLGGLTVVWQVSRREAK